MTGPTTHPLTCKTIIQAVALSAGIPEAELIGRRRLARLAQPRQLAMLIARELTNKSLPEIGRAFGRDHSTILHGIDIARQRLGQDRKLNDIYIKASTALLCAIDLQEQEPPEAPPKTTAALIVANDNQQPTPFSVMVAKGERIQKQNASLGQKITEQRLALGWSVEWLAECAGLSVKVVHKVEAGDYARLTPFEHIAKISAAFGRKEPRAPDNEQEANEGSALIVDPARECYPANTWFG